MGYFPYIRAFLWQQLQSQFFNFRLKKKNLVDRKRNIPEVVKGTENLTTEFNLGRQWPEENIQVFSMYIKANSCFIYLTHILLQTDDRYASIYYRLSRCKVRSYQQGVGLLNISAANKLFSKCIRTIPLQVYNF